MKVCAILLAAGQASRMKAIKALLPLPLLPGGKQCSALEGLAGIYREAGVRDVIVVSGYHAPEVEAAARSLDLAAVRNPEPEQGMFSSIRVGLHAVAPDCDRIFVHPVDVPLVRPLTVHALLQRAEAVPKTVLIPAFEGREGHPPLLPACFVKTIMRHQGGDGLRGALAALPRRLVEVADSFILEDMDRPEDYERLRVLAPQRQALAPAEARCLLRELAFPKKGCTMPRPWEPWPEGWPWLCTRVGRPWGARRVLILPWRWPEACCTTSARAGRAMRPPPVACWTAWDSLSWLRWQRITAIFLCRRPVPWASGNWFIWPTSTAAAKILSVLSSASETS